MVPRNIFCACSLGATGRFECFIRDVAHKQIFFRLISLVHVAAVHDLSPSIFQPANKKGNTPWSNSR
jgi:hypothetical protein